MTPDRDRGDDDWAVRAGWACLPGGRIAEGVDVVVSGGRIAAVGPGAADGLDPRSIVRAPGSTVLPGLIDTHVHLTFSSDEHVVADTADSPDSEQVARGLANAARSVRRGVTTVVDCGGRTSVVLEVRDQLASAGTGPRLLVSGSPITSPGGHCYWLGGEAGTQDEVVSLARRLVDDGVDILKVMLTGGNITAGSNPREFQFPAEVLVALAGECRSLGVPLVAHVHTEEALALAARAGARIVAHASCEGAGGNVAVTEATLRAVAASGAFVDPTIMVGSRTEFPGSTERSASRHDLRSRMLPVFAAMHAGGLPLLAGTDAGVPGVFHGETPEAVVALHREVGLAPAFAIGCATEAPARALGIDGEVGALREGLAADLLLADGDLRSDIEAITRVTHVWRDGILVTESVRP